MNNSSDFVHLASQLLDYADSSRRLVGDTVGLIVWSSAEMGVTLICIGIPVCRPLYKRIYRRFRSQATGSSGYLKQTDPSRDQPGFALHTIGGGVLEPQGRLQGNNRKSMSVIKSENEAGDRQMQVTIGVSEQSRTTVMAQGKFASVDSLDDGSRHLESSADSTQMVLSDEEGKTSADIHHGPDRITVTQTYTVDRG